MKRAFGLLFVLVMVTFVASCSGGGDDTTPGSETGPLAVTLWATPQIGSTPVRVTFTAHVTGGVAPYYYAWDYQATDRNEDGEITVEDLVPDAYRNAEFQRTVSISNDYHLIASDVAGVSQYVAILKVTDSENTTIISQPVLIQVTSDGGMSFDPERTLAWSDYRRPDSTGYFYRTGEPVYFRATPMGGQEPYTYQWDFDNDGSIDSTIAEPEYTYTYDKVGVLPVTASVTAKDSNGEVVGYEFNLFIDGDSSQIPPTPDFNIILNSNPVAVGGVITLKFDDSIENRSKSPEGRTFPIEPELDLSVVVSPVPGEGGVPPYEYYWDFENDGAIDNQFPSPTIPYYDTGLKILVNPFLSNETTKTYTLRCLVIDGTGAIKEIMLQVRAVRQSVANPLQTDIHYGIANAGGTAFLDNPERPYAQVGSPAVGTNALFKFSSTGSTKTYQWQMDMNWDGDPNNFSADYPLMPDPDDPEADPTVDWSDPFDNGDTISHVVKFGPYDDDDDAATASVTDYLGIGYHSVALRIRSINTLNPDEAIDEAIYTVPISLVQRKAISLDGLPIEPRSGHTMSASWSVLNGAELDYIERRHVTIVGGSQGETALRDVERILQTYDEPLEAGNIPTPNETTYIAGLPSINTEREGAALYTFDPDEASFMIVMGGDNPTSGLLASEEQSTAGNGVVANAWDVLGIEILGYYPLTDMFYEEILANDGTSSVNIPPGGMGTFDFLMTGGRVGGDEGSEVGVINSKMISFSMRRPIGVPPYLEVGQALPTPRYDGATVFLDNKYYVIGGRVASGESVGTIEAFNFNTNRWQTEYLPPMANPRSGHIAEAIDGKIYVLGGAFYPGNEGQRSLVLTAEVFNPATGTWSATLPLELGQLTENAASVVMPGPSGVTSTGVVSKNSIWYFGGLDSAEAETASLFEFVYDYTNLPAE